MCAGAGEGVILSTKMYLNELNFPLINAITVVATKIAFEWTLYKISDAARTEMRYKLEESPLIKALGFKPILTIFIPEWAHSTINNFGRWLYNSSVETVNKITLPEFTTSNKQINENITTFPHNETSLYEEQTGMELLNTQQNICSWGEENITLYGYMELALNN